MRKLTLLAVLICVVTCATAWAAVRMPSNAPTDVQFAIKMLQSPEHEDRAQAASWVGSLGEEAAPAVPDLIKLLADPSIGQSNPTPYGPTWASHEADKSLTMIGKPAVPALVRALQDPDWKIRYQAIQALGSILQAKSDSDDDKWLRPVIMSALGDMGAREAVKPLVDALSSKDAEMRSSAASALVSIGTNEAIDKVALVLLKDPEPRVRKSAAEAFTRTKCVRAVEPLIGALDDNYEGVVRSVITALGEIGDQRAVEPLKQLINNREWPLRFDASCTLIKLGDRSQIDALIQALASDKIQTDRSPSVAAALKTGDPAVIEAALSAIDSGRNLDLARSALTKGDDPRITPIMAELLKSDDASIYGTAMTYFDGKKDPDTVDALIANLKITDENKTTVIIYALQNAGDKRAVAPLVDLLKSATGYTRKTILHALATLGVDDQAEGLLIDILKTGEPPARWSAAGLLGQIKTDASVRALITALSDKNAGVRSKAADSLGLIGTNAALEALIDKLMDPNSPIRPDAAKAMGHIGGPQVESYLTAALKDNSEAVRREAASALKPKENPEAAKSLYLAQRMSDWCASAAMSIYGRLDESGHNPYVDKRPMSQIIAALKDPDPKNRLSALYALPSLKDSTAVELLIKMMQTDPSGQNRIEAARALACLKDPRAISPMLQVLTSPPTAGLESKVILAADRATLKAVLEALDDSNEEVARVATDALRQMTLQDLGADKGKWSEWISKNAKP